MLIFPGADNTYTKAQCVAAMDDHPPYLKYDLSDPRIVHIGESTAVLTHRATVMHAPTRSRGPSWSPPCSCTRTAHGAWRCTSGPNVRGNDARLLRHPCARHRRAPRTSTTPFSAGPSPGTPPHRRVPRRPAGSPRASRGSTCTFEVPDAAAAVRAGCASSAATATGAGAVRRPGWSTEVTTGTAARSRCGSPPTAMRDDDPKCAAGDLFYYVRPGRERRRRRRSTPTLLGWELTPGSPPDGWNIVNIRPARRDVRRPRRAPRPVLPGRRHRRGRAAHPGRRRDGGGDEPNQAGRHAACHDDQGVDFGIGSLRQE